ncbi:phage virion morphogenesis protein [Ideonella sp.]|uniref:phage virion morphogenesis protein n=1 Tax=Ideonella sp. TaxID=1929293 RepID=UPI003BB80E43
MAQVDVDLGSARQQLQALHGKLSDLSPLYKILAGVLEDETEANFAAQGRPQWMPLADATKASRLKRNRGSSVLKILQDRGTLAASVSSGYGSDHAEIGAGGAAKDYAGAQQFGATIERPPYSTKVRLRTDRQGNLLRQTKDGKPGKLAVFAKDHHKRARESWHEVAGFTIKIPARPYLPFDGPSNAPVLQAAAQASVLSAITRYLDTAAT